MTSWWGCNSEACWLGREPSKTGLSKTMFGDKGSTGHTLVNTARHGKLGPWDWQFLDIFSNCLLCSLTNLSSVVPTPTSPSTSVKKDLLLSAPVSLTFYVSVQKLDHEVFVSLSITYLT